MKSCRYSALFSSVTSLSLPPATSSASCAHERRHAIHAAAAPAVRSCMKCSFPSIAQRNFQRNSNFQENSAQRNFLTLTVGEVAWHCPPRKTILTVGIQFLTVGKILKNALSRMAIDAQKHFEVGYPGGSAGLRCGVGLVVAVVDEDQAQVRELQLVA